MLEINPDTKQAIYEAVTKDGMTLKEWFLACAENYLLNKDQLNLFDERSIAEAPRSSGRERKTARVPGGSVHYAAATNKNIR